MGGIQCHRVRTALVAILALAFALIPATGAAAKDGDLDPSWSGDGKLTTPFGAGFDVARAVAVQSNGRVVAVGEDRPGGLGTSVNWALARYLPGGTLDPSFGSDGLVTTPFNNINYFFAFGANGVAIQPDSKIVAVGMADNGSYAIARYLSNGSLDPTFSGDGKVTIGGPGIFEFLRDVAVDSAGRIVALGQKCIPTIVGTCGGSGRFVLIRRLSNGANDPSFGGGLVEIDLDPNGTSDFGIGLALAPGGDIVTAGLAHNGGDFDLGIARINPSGAPVGSFSGGDTRIDFAAWHDEAHDVALQADGSVVVAGGTTSGGGFAIARLLFNGNPDNAFSGDGKQQTTFGPGQSSAREVIVQPNGNIVAAGDHALTLFALARYNSDGSLDGTFGSGGRVTTNFGGYDAGRAMAQQADGRLVVAGVASPTGNFSFGLARYLNGPVRRCAGRVASIVATGRRVVGTIENDVIWAGRGRQKITGGKGKDRICSGPGKDVLNGGKGKDKLIAGKGKDKLVGGGGKDKLLGGKGNDICIGGGATDTAKKCETTKSL